MLKLTVFVHGNGRNSITEYSTCIKFVMIMEKGSSYKTTNFFFRFHLIEPQNGGSKFDWSIVVAMATNPKKRLRGFVRNVDMHHVAKLQVHEYLLYSVTVVPDFDQ